jgi:hypothetical protein
MFLIYIKINIFFYSVCLILEVCSFGSLSDIIRGYGFDWSQSHRAPLSLSQADILYLALGCARYIYIKHYIYIYTIS